MTDLTHRCHECVWIRCTLSVILCAMAATDQMEAAERKMRAFLASEGLPEPDEVEYTDEFVNFVWHDEKLVVQIEMD